MKIKELDDKTFKSEILNSDRPVMVDVYTEWCEPCKKLNPIIRQLSQEYAATTKFCMLDADKNPRTVEEYSITSVPTILHFKNGKLFNSLVGSQNKSKLQEILEKD